MRNASIINLKVQLGFKPLFLQLSDTSPSITIWASSLPEALTCSEIPTERMMHHSAISTTFLSHTHTRSFTRTYARTPSSLSLFLSLSRGRNRVFSRNVRSEWQLPALRLSVCLATASDAICVRRLRKNSLPSLNLPSLSPTRTSENSLSEF